MSDGQLLNKNKEELEKEKLQLEIENLEEIKNQSFMKKIGRVFKDWLAILISVCAFVAAVLSMANNVNSYFKQKAQENKLTFDQKLYGLVGDLSSEEKTKRDIAFLFLSTYEKQAVPILFKYLEWEEDPKKIVMMLNVIKNKNNNSKYFDKEYLYSIDQVFDLEIKNLKSIDDAQESKQFEEAQRAITNYLNSMGELVNTSDPLIRELENRLKNIREKLISRKPEINEDVKKALLVRIEEVTKEIKRYDVVK